MGERITDQMQQDLATCKYLGCDNVNDDLSKFTRGSAAGIGEDVLHLQDATVRTSNTQMLPSDVDAEDITARFAKKY